MGILLIGTLCSLFFVAEAKPRSVLFGEVSASASGNPVICLTFDDGPSPETSELLDLLAEYNVHATFFVIGEEAREHPDLLLRIIQEGHTVGLHSDSHDYGSIYRSADAFWEDCKLARDTIESATGITCRFLRFPGGSSNTIHRRYSNRPGLMKDLISGCESRGLIHCDWNVDASDSLNRTAVSASTIFSRVKKNISPEGLSVVLMHDSSRCTTAAEATELILQEYLPLGYSFLSLEEADGVIQHKLD